VKKVIKTKSMVTEEMAVNAVLGEMGRAVDRNGPRRVHPADQRQRAAESHHCARRAQGQDEIADLFAKTHQRPRLTEIPEMTHEAARDSAPALS